MRRCGAFAEAEPASKLGQVAQPLRAALTGTTTSPGIDATLAALGREEALIRISDAASPVAALATALDAAPEPAHGAGLGG